MWDTMFFCLFVKMVISKITLVTGLTRDLLTLLNCTVLCNLIINAVHALN